MKNKKAYEDPWPFLAHYTDAIKMIYNKEL